MCFSVQQVHLLPSYLVACMHPVQINDPGLSFYVCHLPQRYIHEFAFPTNGRRISQACLVSGSHSALASALSVLLTEFQNGRQVRGLAEKTGLCQRPHGLPRFVSESDVETGPGLVSREFPVGLQLTVIQCLISMSQVL